MKTDNFLFNAKTGKFQHQIVQALGEGKIFGELGILTGKERLASIMTAEKTKLAVMDQEIFKRIVKP